MSALPISSSTAPTGATPARRRLPRSLTLGLNRRPRRVWFFAAALILLAVAAAWQRIESEEVDEIARAEARTRLVAALLKAHLGRTFDLADANLKSLDEAPETAPLVIEAKQEPLRRHLKTLVTTGQLFANIMVVDAGGRTLFGARDDLQLPQDLSERPFFNRHRSDRSPDLLISEPTRSRPSGAIVVPLSRRIETHQGAFDGVVVAGLRAEHLVDLHQALEPLSVSAHLLDGTTLARAPEAARVGQRLAVNDPLMTRVHQSPAGTFETGAGTSGRIVGYARLDRWPVVVAVEIDREVALAPWRASRNGTLALALLFIATVIAAFLVIERQLRQLATARIAAEAADRAKSHFLAHMSHELRTPLNAVIGFAEIMGQEVFGPLGNRRYLQYIRDIHLSGEHLLSIIDNILDLAKVSAGNWAVDRRLVSPAEIAADARRLLEPEAESRRIAFAIDLAPDLPTFRTDRRMMSQILLNLTGNALKATPEGGSVRLSAWTKEQTQLVLQVADTGAGMSREEIKLALEPFGAAETVLTARTRETGLGLPLARAFAELLGGRLWIESAAGRGTVATVVLPMGNRSTS